MSELVSQLRGPPRAMPRRLRVLLACGLVHLLMVALSAAYVPLDSLGWLGRGLGFYGVLSGAGSSYGFFASAVSHQLLAHFEIIDEQGVRRPIALETGSSHEADLRATGVTNAFITVEEDAQRFQRALAASLAGAILGRHPEAKQVAVHLEEYTPVSMAEYRKGARPTWSPLYEVRFGPVGAPHDR